MTTRCSWMSVETVVSAVSPGIASTSGLFCKNHDAELRVARAVGALDGESRDTAATFEHDASVNIVQRTRSTNYDTPMK